MRASASSLKYIEYYSQTISEINNRLTQISRKETLNWIYPWIYKHSKLHFHMLTLQPLIKINPISNYYTHTHKRKNKS